MDGTPGRSLTGAARRSRRLQGTPAGHTGGATTATGSPYARPTLKRDASSQRLAALESGGEADDGGGDAVKLDRRKSVGSTDGIFGRVRRSLGWLVGRNVDGAASQTDSLDQFDEKHGDEESMLSGATRPRTRAPPLATPRASSTLTRRPPLPYPNRDEEPNPSLLSDDGVLDGDETSAMKKLRTSHSTLNLPTRRSSPPKASRNAHSSADAAFGTRVLNPPMPPLSRHDQSEGQGTASHRHKANIFAPGLSIVPTHNNFNRAGTSSQRSVSPGGMSQFALAPQPTSSKSSVFGLQSQSPFRAGGYLARSPDLTALNISSGLARSPSLPADRLLSVQRQGSRLYPYQSSSSNLAGLGRPNGMISSHSVGNALSGTKRDYGAMSMSPPRPSPRSQAVYRATSHGLNASPAGTEFSTDFSHRSKRQRVSVAWHPEQGFISTDAEGNPLRSDTPPLAVPKNEAERILERLENIRRPQIDGLRSSSPRRLNIPLPTSTPDKGSIFATRISSSQTEPSLAGYAISPYSRRQQAYREERALRRDKINARGGLGEHLRAAHAQHDSPPPTDDMAHADDSDTAHAREVEVSDDGERDEEESLPKPPARRTRQRTRELSVMSDTSAHMDDTMTSPRRSTRIRKKPAEEAVSRQRAPKSAKSPPPTSGKRGKKKELPTGESALDADAEAGRASNDAVSRRARSPAKQTDSRSTAGRRAVSPANDNGKKYIDQEDSPTPTQPVETPAKAQPDERGLSAREQRLQATAGRKSRSFSAKDDADDIVPALAGVPEQPKLKLPNSVFANRFSFGRSPSSSLLASPAANTSNTNSALASGDKLPAPASETATLPKLVLPSAVSLPNSDASATASSADKSAANTTGLFTPTEVQPSTATSSFTAVSPANASQPVTAPSKPLFSFTAPSKDVPKNMPASTQAHSEDQAAKAGPPPIFSFNAGSSPAAASDGQTASVTAAPFSFGQASTKRKPEEAPPTFTFGKSADSPGDMPVPVIDVTKPSNPFAAFPSSGGTATPPADKETSATSTAKPTFSFGQSSGTPAETSARKTDVPATSSAPSSTAPTLPAFTFGNPPAHTNTASVTGTSAQPSAASDGMQASPPPLSAANDKAPTALFSPVIQPSKTPSFSFGQSSTSSAASAAPTTQTPTFAFGKQAAGQGDTKSGTTSPFSVGAPAQPFAFGVSDSAKTATTFAFGANKPQNQEVAKPTSSAGFNFGSTTPAASNSPAPSFSFGATKAPSTNPFATAPGMQSSGSAFGAPSSVANPGTQPTTAFGQSTTNGSTPSFSFGAQANGASGNVSGSAPGFSFGSSNTSQVSNPPSFSFGSGSTNTGSSQPFVFGGGGVMNAPTPPSGIAAGVPSFNFSAASAPGTQPGSPAGTPTGIDQSGGSFFTIGAGDTPTSPNKARRPVKPLRRPR